MYTVDTMVVITAIDSSENSMNSVVKHVLHQRNLLILRRFQPFIDHLLS